jgi:hypothetical protein
MLPPGLGLTAPPLGGAPLPARRRADHRSILWALRLGQDADGLLRTARGSTGIDVKRVAPAQREAIDADRHRAVSLARHPPTGSTPRRALATRPGETFICDIFGAHSAPSPVDGAVVQFEAVCEYSSLGHIATGKTQTIDDCFNFLARVVLDARSHGHSPARARFDRAPSFRAAEFVNRCATELGIIVTLTPREHHQGVGRCERNHDTLTRRAEAMLQRAGLGTEWLLPARAYAQWLLNRQTSSAAAGAESRYQKYHREVPDFSKLVPFLFWTRAAFVEDVRGPKGSLDHPRGSVGHVVGIEGASYVMFRPGRGTTVHQRYVRPLDEQALVRSGMPPAVAVHDAASQTLFEAAPSPAPPSAPSRAAPPPRPVIDLALGTRIDVAWPSRGPPPSTAWYSGKVVDSTTMSTGRRRHHVAYDGYPPEEWFWHDLASADFEWSFSRQPASVALPPVVGATTRARAVFDAGPQELHARRLATASALADHALESCSGPDHLSRFNASLYQALGDDSSPYECASSDGLDAARLALLAAARGLPSPHRYGAMLDLQCNKASQNVVDVKTPTGTFQYKVPKTHRDVLASQQREGWLAASRAALDAILAWPGNSLVPVSVPRDLGLGVARCVAQYRIKADAATGGLDPRAGHKVRFCVDGGHLSILNARGGFTGSVQTSSSVVDDLVIKLLLADAACYNRILVKADAPNAYMQGVRQERPQTFMEMPAAFADERADDGSELCIQLGTPCWGETPAGYEWQIAFESSLLAIGWRRAEGVPCLWLFTSPAGDALLVTIVDDMLFSESESSDGAIALRTCALLSEKYGDVRTEREPTSFKGFSIYRDRPGLLLRLTLPQKIIETAREHMPALLDGGKLDLPYGQKFQQLADGLQLVSPRPLKLARWQIQIQRIIGSLKFIEGLHPRLSLVIHRLSCVMASPPREAMLVAQAALAAAYAERDVGITYGGAGLSASPRLGGGLTAFIDMNEPAPAVLEGHADATWGDRNVYGLILTYGGAAVLHQTKKISLVVECSMHTEAIASGRAAEIIFYGREIIRAFGRPATEPTLLGTDNLANLRIGSGVGCPTRCKHFLRRYFTLKQRVAAGEIVMRHVPDTQMPADFLTKWIPKAKLEMSIRYATGSHLGRGGPL